MSGFICGLSKRDGAKTMETTSGEIGVGLPLERPPFSKAVFSPSPLHTQPTNFENGKYFFWDRRLVITPQETKPDMRRPALGNHSNWSGGCRSDLTASQLK